MMGSLEPPAPPVKEAKKSARDVMAERDDGNPTDLSTTSAGVLRAQDHMEAAGHLQQEPRARARLAAAMERYGKDLPDPTGAAQVAYAKFNNLSLGGKNAARVKDQWQRLVSGAEMSEAELEQFHGVMKGVDAVTSRLNPGLKVPGIRVARVDLEEDEPYANLEADDPADLVASIPLNSAAVVKAGGEKLQFRVNSTGEASVTGPVDDKTANKLRHMYPEPLEGGGYQWVPSHVRPVVSVDKVRDQFQEPGHVVETYENSALAEVGGHPAMMPGNHLVVETKPEDHKTVLGLLQELGQAVRVKGVEVEAPARDEDWDDDIDQEGMRDAVRTVKLVLTGDAKAVQEAAEQSRLKSVRQAIYMHGDPEGDWSPAQEHLYTDGFRTLAHRAGKAPQAPHSFRVWVRPEEAASLGTRADGINEAGRQVQTVQQQRDGTLLVNGEIRVKGGEVTPAPSISQWRVDGQPVKQVEIRNSGDVPILVPNGTDGTIVRFTSPVTVVCPYPKDSLPAFRALDIVRRLGVDTTDARIQHPEAE